MVRLHVVIPVLSLHRGGGCRVLIELANQLVDRGHRVDVVMLEREPVAWPLRCQVTRVPALTASVIPECDLILPNFWPTVLPAVASGKGRVVRWSNGFEPLWVAQREEALRTYQMGLPVITLGPHLRRVIRESTGQDSFIAQPGVDGSIFRPLDLPRAPGRRVFFIYRSEAHGYHYKGNADLVEAMRRVMQVEPRVHLMLVGTEQDTPGTPPISLPIPFHAAAAKTDAEMAQVYNQADLYVLASWFEALSIPPLEAMACGTPVVLTDCGGTSDYARPGENCLIAPPRRPDLLAELILTGLRNQPLRERLIQGGKATAAQWTWERFGDQVEAALYAILGGATEPPAEV
ncbi:MAG: glycosyltransferase family 4 protein [Bacillota bacterium]